MGKENLKKSLVNTKEGPRGVSAEKWNGKALAASWDSDKLMGQWVLLTKLEPGVVEVPCDMLGTAAHMTDPSWDSGAFS